MPGPRHLGLTADAAVTLRTDRVAPHRRGARYYSRGDVLAKIGGWLAAGTLLAWAIYPERSEAQVFRQNGTVSIIGPDGTLDGEDVLPGLSMPLADVLS